MRGNVAIPQAQLLAVNDTGGRQSCSTFGVHPKLHAVRSLFADGDAAFFANIGALAEPLTKAEFRAKTKKLPNSLFAHNAQQTTAANLHADSRTAKGVLGRMSHVLATVGGRFKVGQYSIAGNQKILEGDGEVARIVGRRNGIEQFRYYAEVGRRMANLSSVRAESVYAETYANLLERAFEESEGLGSILDSANISQAYMDASDGESKLCEQFMWVAKLVDLRTHELLRSERDTFYVELGGFDTHSDVEAILNAKLEEVNKCLDPFVSEMKRKGTWPNVAIATLSGTHRTQPSRRQLSCFLPSPLYCHPYPLPNLSSHPNTPPPLPSLAPLPSRHLSGDCVSFGPVRRRRFRTRLAERLRRRNRAFVVDEDHIYLNVGCGSVNVASSIVTPDAGAATDLQSDLQADLLVNTSLAAEALGETVVAVGVASIGPPLVIDAPSPPPTPPPSPSLPPPSVPLPSAPAATPALVPASPLSSSDDRQEEVALPLAIAMEIWLILACVGAVSMCLLACLIGYCCGVKCGKARWTSSGANVVAVEASGASPSRHNMAKSEARGKEKARGKQKARGHDHRGSAIPVRGSWLGGSRPPPPAPSGGGYGGIGEVSASSSSAPDNEEMVTHL